MTEVDVQIHAYVYAHALSFILIIGLDAEAMPAAIERIGNRSQVAFELQEIILHVDVCSYMVLFSVPVEGSVRP